MDFAKKELEKYGWQEGKGLGKQEDGISEALRPSLKFDTTGVGYDHSKQFTNNWWEKIFNKTANNIQVVKTREGDVCVSTDNKTSNSDVPEKLKKLRKSSDVKKTILKKGTETVVSKKKIKSNKIKGVDNHNTRSNNRIDKQEKLLYRQLRKISLSDNKTKDGKKKNEKKLKRISMAMKEVGEILERTINSVNTSTPSIKSDVKTERKRVSFNNTATEYVLQDTLNSSSTNSVPDTSCESDTNSAQTPFVKVQVISVNDAKDVSDTNSELEAKIHLEYRSMRRTLRKLRKLEKDVVDMKPGPSSVTTVFKEHIPMKRKMEVDSWDGERKTKIKVKDSIPLSNLGTAEDKRRRMELKKKIRLEKKINKIATSLGNFNISDNTAQH